MDSWKGVVMSGALGGDVESVHVRNKSYMLSIQCPLRPTLLKRTANRFVARRRSSLDERVSSHKMQSELSWREPRTPLSRFPENPGNTKSFDGIL